MGLLYIAKQYKLTGAVRKTPDQSAGPVVVVNADDGNGDTMTPEVWEVPGHWSMPPDGTYGVRLPIGGGNFGAIVATHHYKTADPGLAKGETAVGSTTADGVNLRAVTKYRVNGDQELNGNSKRLVTWGELDTALTALMSLLNSHVHQVVSLGAPTLPAPTSTPPTTFSIDITPAKTTTIKTGG